MVAGGIGIVSTSFFLTLQFIDLYAGRDLGLAFVHQRSGYPDLYLIDNKGLIYLVPMIGDCWLAAPIPPDSAGFTLYFQALPPFQFNFP